MSRPVKASAAMSLGNGHLAAAVFGQHADKTVSEGFSLAAVEDVAFDLAAVFAGDENVAAIIKGLFERGVNFFWSRKVRHPAFQLLMLESGDDFERVGIGFRSMQPRGLIPCRSNPCLLGDFVRICTSGL